MVVCIQERIQIMDKETAEKAGSGFGSVVNPALSVMSSAYRRTTQLATNSVGRVTRAW